MKGRHLYHHKSLPPGDNWHRRGRHHYMATGKEIPPDSATGTRWRGDFFDPGRVYA